MDVVYDLKKNAANIKKHGVDFEDAQVVLLDPFALTGKMRTLRMSNDFFNWASMPLGAYWSSYSLT